MAVEGFEESLGLDPNDPLVPFLLFLGLSVTLWYKSFLDIFVLFKFVPNDLRNHISHQICAGVHIG